MAGAAGVLEDAGAEAPLREVLAAALQANERLARALAELRGENARLREALAGRDAELEQAQAALAVLQRMVFGRSSERSRPEAADGGTGGGERAGGGARRRGQGARAGRRDWSHLPHVEVTWDFSGNGYWCP